MGATRTVLARANARAGVLGSIAAVILLLTGFGTAVVDSLTGAALSGLRDGITTSSGVDGAVRWQIRIAGDGSAQAEAAASVLDRMIVPSGADWGRSVQTAPVDASSGGGAFGAVLLADHDLPARASLSSGAWPDDVAAASAAAAVDAVPAALHAAAADALDLTEGDVVDLHGGDATRRLLVVGTWLPDDPGATAWFGDPIVATGTVEGGAGPFLVGDDAVVGLPATTVVRWTATADAASMTPERAAALRTAIPNVEPALRAEPAMGDDGLSTLGGLPATLERLLAGLGAVRAIAPLPVLLLALAGLAAIDRLAALLAASRRGETVLLRARGASAWRLARDTALEVLAVGLPSAVLGVAAAEALLAVVRPDDARGWANGAVAASVTLAGAVLLVAGRAWRDATRPVVRTSGDEVGRMPRAAAAGGVVVVAVAAVISLWQFRLYGSPLVARASGALEVDALAVLAPVLVPVALSLLALGASRPFGVLLERSAARRPGLVPALPMRQLARRAGLYGSASLVTMIAVAGLTLAAAFAGSWQAFDRAAAAVSTGGDVRVVLVGRDVVRGTDPFALADPFAAVPGVAASGAIARGEVRIGSDPATLVALPTPRLAEIAPGTDLRGAGLDALASSGEAAGPRLPVGAAEVAADVRLDAPPGTPGTVTVFAWVLGSDGTTSRLPAGSFDVAGGGGTATATLPDGSGLRLLGFEATLAGSQGAADVTVAVGAVTVDGATSAPVGATGAATLSATRPSGRVPTTADDAPVPVLLGATLAARIRAEPGDALAFRVLTGGAEVRALVAGIVPAVPGAGDAGLMADLGALSRAAFVDGAGVPAAAERWLATSDPDAVADALERGRTTALVVSTRADASSASLVGPAAAALWAGAGGALVFALIAVVALAAALGRARFGEVVVLRVVGVPPRLQARARFAELAAAVTTSAAIGIVVGVIASLATVPELARAAVAGAPAALPVDLHADWVPWLVGFTAFLALTAAIAAGAAASVRRTASRPGIREEER
ncbi:hypothetical protein [Agromyces sp. H66]|uniref:hypothetical protein n=1 Tax=Agromyces sp. H66 TaxID=2529859 RepID=UPI0010AB0816|nr:hypothetical protein [Agromyces sp. H66]